MTDTIKMLTPTWSLFTDRRLLVASQCGHTERLLEDGRGGNELGELGEGVAISQLLGRQRGRVDSRCARVTGHGNVLPGLARGCCRPDLSH